MTKGIARIVGTLQQRTSFGILDASWRFRVKIAAQRGLTQPQSSSGETPEDKAPESEKSDTLRKKKWSGAGSNRRHLDFQSSALPTELPNPIRPRRENAAVPEEPILHHP